MKVLAKSKNVLKLLLQITICAALLPIFLTHNPQDPSFNHLIVGQNELEVHNAYGKFGAYTADFLLQIFGLSIVFFLLFKIIFDLSRIFRWNRFNNRFFLWTVNILLLICFVFLANFLYIDSFNHNSFEGNGGILGNVLQNKTPLENTIIWQGSALLLGVVLISFFKIRLNHLKFVMHFCLVPFHLMFTFLRITSRFLLRKTSSQEIAVQPSLLESMSSVEKNQENTPQTAQPTYQQNIDRQQNIAHQQNIERQQSIQNQQNNFNIYVDRRSDNHLNKFDDLINRGADFNKNLIMDPKTIRGDEYKNHNKREKNLSDIDVENSSINSQNQANFNNIAENNQSSAPIAHEKYSSTNRQNQADFIKNEWDSRIDGDQDAYDAEPIHYTKNTHDACNHQAKDNILDISKENDAQFDEDLSLSQQKPSSANDENSVINQQNPAQFKVENDLQNSAVYEKNSSIDDRQVLKDNFQSREELAENHHMQSDENFASLSSKEDHVQNLNFKIATQKSEFEEEKTEDIQRKIADYIGGGDVQNVQERSVERGDLENKQNIINEEELPGEKQKKSFFDLSKLSYFSRLFKKDSADRGHSSNGQKSDIQSENFIKQQREIAQDEQINDEKQSLQIEQENSLKQKNDDQSESDLLAQYNALNQDERGIEDDNDYVDSWQEEEQEFWQNQQHEQEILQDEALSEDEILEELEKIREVDPQEYERRVEEFLNAQEKKSPSIDENIETKFSEDSSRGSVVSQGRSSLTGQEDENNAYEKNKLSILANHESEISSNFADDNKNNIPSKQGNEVQKEIFERQFSDDSLDAENTQDAMRNKYSEEKIENLEKNQQDLNLEVEKNNKEGDFKYNNFTEEKNDVGSLQDNYKNLMQENSTTNLEQNHQDFDMKINNKNKNNDGSSESLQNDYKNLMQENSTTNLQQEQDYIQNEGDDEQDNFDPNDNITASENFTYTADNSGENERFLENEKQILDENLEKDNQNNSEQLTAESEQNPNDLEKNSIAESCHDEDKLRQNIQEEGQFAQISRPKKSPIHIHKIGLPGPLYQNYKCAINFLAKFPDYHKMTHHDAQILEIKGKELLGILNDFGVLGKIINIHPGPVVTLFEFQPVAGVKSSKVIALSDDIARSLCAASARISIIHGKNALGIEIPNPDRDIVFLRELLEFIDDEDGNENIHLPIALGKRIDGSIQIVDLTKMPHLLIAGTTGSGKSVAINTMIISLLFKLSPQKCRLVMIDPKMLELSIYNDIPHLLTPVITDPKKAIVALKWIVSEMEQRYQLMTGLSVRNIAGFNEKIAEAKARGQKITIEKMIEDDGQMQAREMELEELPFIVVIVDEMADLMLVAGKEIEILIQRLAQMARAAGIHIIMATQRPSVDVITGVIKANFPTRISFAVTSKIDSRTILGEQGAEQLLGMGDMLYMQNGGKILRLHGAFVSDLEVQKIVENLKNDFGSAHYVEAIEQEVSVQEGASFLERDFDESGDEDDELFGKAVEIVWEDQKTSISYIQRKLRIGYNRAANLIERMERERIISPPDSSGKRTIL